MKKSISVRMFYGVMLVTSVLFLPWWIVVVLMLIGALIFDHLYESVVAGVCMDVLYGTYGVTVVVAPILFSLIGLCVLGINIGFKKLVRI